MPDQLSFDGRAMPYPMPPPRRLNQRQRDVLRYLRVHDEITTDDARRFYARPADALGRLVALGLVDHPKRGRWRAARPWAALSVSLDLDPDDGTSSS